MACLGKSVWMKNGPELKMKIIIIIIIIINIIIVADETGFCFLKEV